MSAKGPCQHCQREYSLNSNGKVRKHDCLPIPISPSGAPGQQHPHTTTTTTTTTQQPAEGAPQTGGNNNTSVAPEQQEPPHPLPVAAPPLPPSTPTPPAADPDPHPSPVPQVPVTHTPHTHPPEEAALQILQELDPAVGLPPTPPQPPAPAPASLLAATTVSSPIPTQTHTTGDTTVPATYMTPTSAAPGPPPGSPSTNPNPNNSTSTQAPTHQPSPIQTAPPSLTIAAFLATKAIHSQTGTTPQAHTTPTDPTTATSSPAFETGSLNSLWDMLTAASSVGQSATTQRIDTDISHLRTSTQQLAAAQKQHERATDQKFDKFATEIEQLRTTSQVTSAAVKEQDTRIRTAIKAFNEIGDQVRNAAATLSTTLPSQVIPPLLATPTSSSTPPQHMPAVTESLPTPTTQHDRSGQNPPPPRRTQFSNERGNPNSPDGPIDLLSEQDSEPPRPRSRNATRYQIRGREVVFSTRNLGSMTIVIQEMDDGQVLGMSDEGISVCFSPLHNNSSRREYAYLANINPSDTGDWFRPFTVHVYGTMSLLDVAARLGRRPARPSQPPKRARRDRPTTIPNAPPRSHSPPPAPHPTHSHPTMAPPQAPAPAPTQTQPLPPVPTPAPTPTPYPYPSPPQFQAPQAPYFHGYNPQYHPDDSSLGRILLGALLQGQDRPRRRERDF